MKKLLNMVIGAVLGLGTAPAMAQKLAQDWSGAYAGVQVGYGSGDAGGRVALAPAPRFD